jgi:uncharacterized membrane protein YkvA (DUF1232 family)
VGGEIMDEQQKDKRMNLESALTPKMKEPGFWREMWQQARLVYYLLRDPEVPFYLKLLPFTAVVYFLFPFDLVTDFAPVIGQLDDITALLVGSKIFIEMAPQHIVAKHMEAIRLQDGYAGGEIQSGDDLADAIIIEGEHEIIEENEKGQS